MILRAGVFTRRQTPVSPVAPHCALLGPGGSELSDKDPALCRGAAAAIRRDRRLKGLGGYHLACNALDNSAVATLGDERSGKRNLSP